VKNSFFYQIVTAPLSGSFEAVVGGMTTTTKNIMTGSNNKYDVLRKEDEEEEEAEETVKESGDQVEKNSLTDVSVPSIVSMQTKKKG
jgi:hypothetical protein